jgi:hypothetical protein
MGLWSPRERGRKAAIQYLYDDNIMIFPNNKGKRNNNNNNA